MKVIFGILTVIAFSFIVYACETEKGCGNAAKCFTKSLQSFKDYHSKDKK